MFDVSSLPQVFTNLEWPARFIWFDLFCIPQKGHSQRMATEIGKQAEIFQQAENMVIWHNNGLGWECMEKLVAWLGLNYLRRTETNDMRLQRPFVDLTDDMNEQESRDAAHAEDGYVDVWNKHTMVKLTTFGDRWEGHTDGDKGPMWYSSLWTLQEAYLCPGALLADRNWKFLGVGPGHSRMLVTLDNIASLASGPPGDLDRVHEARPAVQRPSMVSTFKRTMMKWQLADIAMQNPCLLLLAAESRGATGPRVEAIMAAMGCTAWWLEANRDERHSEGLVLSMYPVEFLREAQHRLGGVFWLYRRGPPDTMRDVEAGEPVGSLLPLATNPRAWQFVRDPIDVVDDLSQGALTEDWEIQSKNTVIVTEAVVLSDKHDLVSDVDVPFTIFSSGMLRTFKHFKSWTREEVPEAPHRVAAVVAYDIHRSYGVILEGKDCPSGTRLVLVRVGVFQTEGGWGRDPDTADKQPVEWIVITVKPDVPMGLFNHQGWTMGC